MSADESKTPTATATTEDSTKAPTPVPDKVAKSRSVEKTIYPREQPEGAGATVRRAIGNHKLRYLDPFLMLDHFNVKKPAGFPDHPHRGFETVTYMLEGSTQHEDFCGHKGVINAGDLQWMTAGRGIVHAEMPQGDKPSIGLQLWVNLAAKDKFVEPAYQELLAKDIPAVEHEGVYAKVIAGKAFGVSTPVVTRTPTLYLDFTMKAGSSFNQAIPEGWNGFAYLIKGTAAFGPKGTKESPVNHVLVLSTAAGEDGVTVTAGAEGCHFVLICGEPIGEPVVQHGPFVMNTREEIMRAFSDYQSGRNGFERARRFRSTISTGVDL